jgi:hypothetical protein
MFIGSIVNRPQPQRGGITARLSREMPAPLELTTYLIGLAINMSPHWGWSGPP